MKLNPCPFCGSSAELSDDYLFFSVNCTNANCEIETKRFRFKLDAITAWNKRHNPLHQAMLNSLMKRYAVNGKISDVGMPIYDRECLKLLFEQGVLSLSNGLYYPY